MKLTQVDYALMAVALALLVTVAVRALGVIDTSAPPRPGDA